MIAASEHFDSTLILVSVNSFNRVSRTYVVWLCLAAFVPERV